jgi:hypothetical protein
MQHPECNTVPPPRGGSTALVCTVFTQRASFGDNVSQKWLRNTSDVCGAGEDYHHHLAQYMFAARCKAQGVSPFLQFPYLVANTDWLQCDVPSSAAHAT